MTNQAKETKLEPLTKRRFTKRDAEIGARVRFKRRQKKVTQQKLASMLGITFQQVQKYERGTNRIAASRLEQIALHLKTPLLWFFKPGAPDDE